MTKTKTQLYQEALHEADFQYQKALMHAFQVLIEGMQSDWINYQKALRQAWLDFRSK